MTTQRTTTEFCWTCDSEQPHRRLDKAEETGSPLTLTPFTPNRDCRNTLPLDLEVVTFEGRR